MKHNVSYSEGHPPVRSSVLQTIMDRVHITPEECGNGGFTLKKKRIKCCPSALGWRN